jgi:hypothetical protein
MLLFYVLFLVLIWLINLEINPSLGGIWWRVNATGNKAFHFGNILNMIYHSFINPLFWKIQMIDVNIITFLILGLLIIYSVDYGVSYYIKKTYGSL